MTDETRKVSLFPGVESVKGQPVPSVVETLEELLERAKAGEITGIAYAFVCSKASGRDTTVTGWTLTHWGDLAGAVGTLNARFFGPPE